MKRRKSEPARTAVSSTDWLGRVLVYANGHRSKIINVGCKVNGQTSVILQPEGREAMGPWDTFATVEDISTWLRLGIWSIEESRPNNDSPPQTSHD